MDQDNVHKLNSKIIYTVACDSALELGQITVTKGKARAFIGYESNFMIVVDPSRIGNPAKDKNFVPFREDYLYLIMSLLSGFNIKEAVERTKDFMRSQIRDYGVQGSRDRYGDAQLIRFGLFWNLYNLKVYGNDSVAV